MSKFKVWIDTTAGEPILTEWANELCEGSAKAIGDRVVNIDPKMKNHGREVKVTEGKIEETRGKKAKYPKGHRRAYYVRLKAFGRKSEDLQKLLRKSMDAGKF